MARGSMTDIIQYLRDLIGDTSTTQVFDDDTIQVFCDRRQEEIRLFQLTGIYSVIVGGFVRYLNYYADLGQWETDYVLQDNTWNVVTADSSDLQNGKWTFNTEPKWPIYITGKTYDVYAIAADLCDAWAAKLALKIDNQSGQFKNARSQAHTHMSRQARMFRAQARVKSAKMVRTDLTGD